MTKLTQLYDNINVVIVGPGDPVPYKRGESGWDPQGRAEYVYLDPEEFQPGQEKWAGNPSGCVRDSHEYLVRCEEILDKGETVIGIFDITGYHTADSPDPGEPGWETRELLIVCKVKREVEEQMRNNLKRHLIGLIKALQI